MTTSNRTSDLTADGPISRNGLEALLTPDNCVLLLIDHQAFQFAGLRSHDTQTIINNVVGLTKSAKVFGVPTLFTTVLERQGGYLLKPLQDVFPDQKPIDRTFINTWEDSRVVDWVRKTGRKKQASSLETRARNIRSANPGDRLPGLTIDVRELERPNSFLPAR